MLHAEKSEAMYEEMENQMYTELPQPSKKPLLDKLNPLPLNVPINVCSSSSVDHDDIDILKEKFDPSLMDAIVQMLQSTKLSVYQERTPPVKSSVPISPQIPPSLPPLDMDHICPELEENSNSEDENRKPKPKPYTNISVSKPKIHPPLPPEPKGWRELKPSKSTETR